MVSFQNCQNVAERSFDGLKVVILGNNTEHIS